MFEQAVLPIQDETTFTAVRGSMERSFASGAVERFLRGVSRAGLRARQFEAILAEGLLGPEAQTAYAALGDSDRGHVREQYLGLVEKVAPELRQRFLKVYAYY